MNNASSTTAIVVTFNRRELLERCLAALATQSLRPDRIVLVDNASTDGTHELGAAWVLEDPVRHHYIRLTDNLGGAGGFARGIQESICNRGWMWLMDDDAEPEPAALASLLDATVTTSDIYGSLARSGDMTSWTTTLLLAKGATAVDYVREVPDIAEVKSLPFLGFMVHSDLVERLGLPDEGYFIAGDDIEYCVRARAAGSRIHVVGRSLIRHPPAARGRVTVLGLSIAYLSLPPWKRYYDTRNRILTARRHAGWLGTLSVILSTFWRLGLAVSRERAPGEQARAILAGLVDGVFCRKGKRHSHWGVRT